jgi:ribosomal protein S18 acetylase RimI-like enzyme
MKKHMFGAIVLAAVMLISGITYNGFYSTYMPLTGIPSVYNDTFQLCKTDEQCGFVKKVYKDNFALLTVNPYHDFDVMLKKRAPNKHEAKYFGKLDTVVLYDQKQPVGFVSYYMTSSYMGRVLFLAVDKQFRRKGYAKRLMSFAIDHLKKQGVKIIKVATYEENKKAQQMYTQRFGFVKENQEGKILHYRKDV